MPNVKSLQDAIAAVCPIEGVSVGPLDWLDMARTSQQGIDLSDSKTMAAAAALVSSGLLTQSQADVIFAS